MSDTLVIHLDDRSTDFLRKVYEGKGYDVITNGDMPDEELVKELENHSRIMMMGHGLPYGLINVNGRQNNRNPYFINSSHADILRTKETISIWCFSNEFFEANDIRDGNLHTGMVISEVGEERMMLGYAPLDRDELLANMNLYAETIGECIDMKGEAMRTYFESKYNGNDPVSEFNRDTFLFV